MTASEESRGRTSRGQVSNHRPLLYMMIMVLLLGGAFYLMGGSAADDPAPGHAYEAGTVLMGGESDSLDAACADTFGETWESKAWFPNNPPTVACSNGEQTGYMDMPVDIQRESDIVSTQQPNGTVNFVLDDRTEGNP